MSIRLNLHCHTTFLRFNFEDSNDYSNWVKWTVRERGNETTLKMHRTFVQVFCTIVQVVLS